MNLDVSFGTWAALTGLVVVLLVFDLVVFGRGKRDVTMRESVLWSVFWLALGLLFTFVVLAWYGGTPASEYLAGYLLERSLSLDNLFVFAVIFGFFAVPPVLQPRVLAWGIELALVLRLIFILIGAALLDAFHATYYLFGLLLAYTAFKLATHDNSEIEPENNPALRLLRRRVRMTTEYRGAHMIVREDGQRIATPLLAVFVVVATTDLLFAVDSIPAIFAVTEEPVIVFAANAFAMLGLRSLFFVLAGMMDRFVHLSYGLAIILGFIGVKMLLIDVWHPPIWLSLAVIVGVLGVTTWTSARFGGPNVESKSP